MFFTLTKGKKEKDYNRLLPFGSDSDYDDDVDEKQNLVIDQTSVPEVSVRETHRTNLPPKTLKDRNGYRFSGSDYSKRTKCCSPTTVATVFALMLLSIGVGYIAGFLTPTSILPWQRPQGHVTTQEHRPSVHKRTADWRTKLSDYGKIVQTTIFIPRRIY